MVILASVFLLGTGYFFATCEEVYFDQGYAAAKRHYLPELQAANARIDQLEAQLMDCKAWEQRLIEERDDAITRLTRLEYLHADLQEAFTIKSDSLIGATAAMKRMKGDIIALLERIEELENIQEQFKRVNRNLEATNAALHRELSKMKKAVEIKQQVSSIVQSRSFYAVSSIILMIISGLVWRARRKKVDDYV